MKIDDKRGDYRMLEDWVLEKYRIFLSSHYISKLMTVKLIVQARRDDGLPTPISLRTALNRIESGIANISVLNFIISDYVKTFDPTFYKKKKPRVRHVAAGEQAWFGNPPR